MGTNELLIASAIAYGVGFLMMYLTKFKHYWLLSFIWFIPIFEVDNMYFRIFCIVCMIANFLQIIRAYDIDLGGRDFE